MWVPDFSPAHYDQMLYTKSGITSGSARTSGARRQAGIDLSGYTMHNMYLEMSKGAYTVDGQATPWVTVPHSEAWYGAATCPARDGVWDAGASQDARPPDNPPAPASSATDAVDALAAADPSFPWADYDIEDQGDGDGDGNFNEPDGVIDHLVLVHAGEDKSRGGGAQGTYADLGALVRHHPGHTIPGTNLRCQQLHRAAGGLRGRRVRPRVRPRPGPAGPLRHLRAATPTSTSGT